MRLAKPAVLARPHQLRGSAAPADDHRHAHRERFERCIRKRVVKGGKDKAIRCGIKRSHILQPAGKAHSIGNSGRRGLRSKAGRMAVPAGNDELQPRVAAARERFDRGRKTLALEARAHERKEHVLRRAAERVTCLRAQFRAMARMKMIELHAVVDHVQLRQLHLEVPQHVFAHHLRVADHCPQSLVLEHPALDPAHIAVIGIGANLRALERGHPLEPQFQPLAVHAIARAIEIAAGNPLVRLHQVEALAPPRGARRPGEGRVAPPAAEVGRVHAQDAARAPAFPAPRDQGDLAAGALERTQRLRNEALGAAVRRIALAHDGQPHCSSSRAAA